MKSIYNYIEDLNEHEWNYYANFPNNVTLPKPFVDDITSTHFIEAYFKKGGKSEVLSDFNVDDFPVERAEHTVCLFFFGAILFNNSKFREKVFFPDPRNEKYEFFPFIWFLTCLAHDGAFHQENTRVIFPKVPTLEKLKKFLNIKHDLTKERVSNVPVSLFKNCAEYYHYRYKEHKCIDHGIYAGILLYDRLVKNRKFQKNLDGTGLNWSESLDREYAFAAGTIAVHNMWLPAFNKVDEYKRFKLFDLVNERNINFRASPLLYFLGIIDSIEPVKAYKDKPPDFVIKNVFLSLVDDTKIELCVSPFLDFKVLKSKAAKLRDWLDVTVSCDHHIIRIAFNF